MTSKESSTKHCHVTIYNFNYMSCQMQLMIWDFTITINYRICQTWSLIMDFMIITRNFHNKWPQSFASSINKSVKMSLKK